YPAGAAASRVRQRQVECEARSSALGRVDPDAAAHGRDEAARDEEPEPCAARAARGLGAVELREDVLALGFGDPPALVDDADLDAAAAPMGLDRDRSAVG